MTDGRKYSDAEVRAIIDRALASDSGGAPGLSHEELLAVGEQVGVPSAVMSRAAADVRAEKLGHAARDAVTSRWRRWLVAHAVVFAVLNGLLFAVNAATTPGQWWVLFSVFFWGLALLLHAGLVFALAPSEAALAREKRRLAAGREPSSRRLRVEPATAAAAAATDAVETASETSQEERARR